MQIDAGIAMLSVSAPMMGAVVTIHPVLLWDDRDAVLIDTSYPGQFPMLLEQISNAGLAFSRINKLIVTHQDLDHIGSVGEMKSSLGDGLEVIASEFERPFIQGEKRLLKLTDEAVAQAVSALPESVPAEWRAAFKRTLEHPPRADVDTALEGAAELGLCGGIAVIPTPGHTPGHISLYHRPSRTLIAGDAIEVSEGRLTVPNPALCTDPEQSVRSLERLLDYDIRRVACYHGGLYDGDPRPAIAQWLREY